MTTERTTEQSFATQTLASTPGQFDRVVDKLIVTELVRENIGPRGSSSGGGSSAFTFRQPTPALVWTIAHNLGVFPSVTTLSSGNLEIKGKVNHISNNVVTVTFLSAVSGSAHLV